MEVERRRYPQENDGAKNHWKGLIKHQGEIEVEISKVEKVLKEARTKELQYINTNKIKKNYLFLVFSTMNKKQINKYGYNLKDNYIKMKFIWLFF